MLTAYDYSTARVFDEAGIPVLLVGDSAANVVYGYDTTVPVTVDELLPLVRARRARDEPRARRRRSAVRLVPGFAAAGARDRRALHEGGRRAGGQARGRPARRAPGRGARLGRHPGHGAHRPDPAVGQRARRLPGAGRGDEAAHRLVQDAKAMQHAGAFAVVLEVVPSDLAAQVTKALHIPTIGIGAGPATDAQVLVWQDMAGFNEQARRSSSSASPTSRRCCATRLPSTPTRCAAGHAIRRPSTSTTDFPSADQQA